ncbi:hypothetical protein NAEGRDRAFT_80899 [Naegleria gruberi]|uniref:ASCH domain-containing protein n=1 Tax=Naegleria gruberi TaxID=5762 RepID=D2VQS1_NAEGR|nr:uncharacterized protein NAEGRDRAFT_80899 [Naegleria gruberi]EFC40754.1 hypothetical protein NAEGRDRAFT_80899 [Naegleria gruberi]|eukprot:XP_002673498.1 hypothetical protein NAEGRDRAFT_80899 [Naegleria gruberi strain NEG-M]
MSKKDTKEFPSLPQSSVSHQTTIGDTIRIGGAYVNVKHGKKKGGGGPNTSSNTHKNTSSSSNNLLINNGLSDKANDHLNRINKNFEFAKNLKENKVLTNCTTCGRIITAEEGFGPCPFCQTNITPDVVNQYYNSSDDHCLPKNKQGNEDYQKALELRNRLLRWDENYSQTTAVIDEQAAEYGNSSTANDIWLSESEKKNREKIEERIKELKEQMKNKHGQPLRYIFDFAGKRVLLDESHQIETQKELDKLIESLKVTTPKNKKEEQPSTGVVQKSGSNVGMQRSSLLDVTKLKFIESKDKKQKPEQPEEMYNSKGGIVQNPYFDFNEDRRDSEKQCGEGSGDTIDGLEPTINYCEPISTHEDDAGMCMSMHQPWASLLVHGIKIHEGRAWPTDHRGRLWIASTAEEPTPEGIEELESYYKNDFDRTQGYPKHYPTSVILGCVDVIDCLSYEEYCDKFSPEEQESESDYVFICANPRRLFLPYPISGKPKIYKLSKEQLSNCQLGLKPLPNKTM